MKKAIVVSVCAVLVVGSGMLAVAFSHGEAAESQEPASFDAAEEGAGIEDSWKNLLEICKNSDFVPLTSVGSIASVELDGKCRYSARMICRTQFDDLNSLGEIVRFRLSKIRDFACALKQRFRRSTDEILRTCYIAVGTGQTGWPGWEKDLNSCLSEADQCQDWFSYRSSCSYALNAIEFTSHWQQLVEACEVSVDADMEFGRFPAIEEIDSIIRSFTSALENSIPTIECQAIAGELCQRRIGRADSISSVRQLAKSVDTRNSRIQRAACALHENQSPRVASVVTAVPEVEVPPSTALSAGTAPETSAPVVAAVPSATVPEVLLRNGVAMVGWDLTVETAEVVDAAVEACSEVFATSIMAGCAAFIGEACYSMRSDRVKLSGAVGPTNFEAPELNGAVGLVGILCSEVYTAEVVELAMVLAAKYGDRYYSEDTSLPFGEDPDYDLQDFEYNYMTPGGGLRAFAEGIKRDFIDFRMYVDRKAWDPRRAIDFGPFQFISDEARVRVSPLFKVIGELKSAFSDSSSGPFEGFDAEKVIAFYSADSDDTQRVIDLPEDPEEIELFCDEAFDAARYRKQGWENSLNNCFTAAENCADILGEDQNSMCGELSRRAKRSLKWNTLPRVCAAAEDIKAGDFDDSCRRAVLDIYLNYLGDPRSATLAGGPTALVFFLAQPLIADLPIEYRRFYSLQAPNNVDPCIHAPSQSSISNALPIHHCTSARGCNG